jgi:hypothetical protein
MLSKTRTTIITLVAAFSFGSAAIVPTVAQADTKTGSKATEQRCEQLAGIFEEAVNEASQLYEKEGNGTAFKGALGIAGLAKHIAANEGCDWASRVRLPNGSPTSGLVPPPVGGIKGAPEAPPPPSVRNIMATSTPPPAK